MCASKLRINRHVLLFTRAWWYLSYNLTLFYICKFRKFPSFARLKQSRARPCSDVNRESNEFSRQNYTRSSRWLPDGNFRVMGKSFRITNKYRVIFWIESVMIRCSWICILWFCEATYFAICIPDEAKWKKRFCLLFYVYLMQNIVYMPADCLCLICLLMISKPKEEIFFY